jgi:ferredoxin
LPVFRDAPATIPAHLKGGPLDDLTKSLMGGASSNKRISIKGGIFRMVVDGEEIAKKMGYPGGMYRVGPLARVNVADNITTPLANKEFKEFKKLGNGGMVEGSLFFHYARLIEGLYAKVDIYHLVENLESCLQCGKCAGICPVARLSPSYNPRQIIHDILNGRQP